MSEQEFTEWFCKNYPPDTIIVDPKWHAPRIYRRLATTTVAAQPNARLLNEVADVLAEQNWRGDLVEALRDAAGK